MNPSESTSSSGSGDHTEDAMLLKAIRHRQADAWSLLIERYQGRLITFAMARLGQRADAEDLVQDAFVSLIKSIDSFRGEASLETYLYTILRHKIIDRYRTKSFRSVSLIQEVYGISVDRPSFSPSTSWCVNHNEQCQILKATLSEALQRLLNKYKASKNFYHLKVMELFLYTTLPGKEIAKLLNVKHGTVRTIKKRALGMIHQQVFSEEVMVNVEASVFEDLLSEAWETQRLSCLKRSTLSGFLCGKLEPDWFDYVDFHLTTLGCHYCRANLKDLKSQGPDPENQDFRQRIVASTVGFLTRS